MELYILQQNVKQCLQRRMRQLHFHFDILNVGSEAFPREMLH